MKNRGFTLVELLAVIVILAILMLAASSNVFGILDNAQKGSFRTEFLQLLESAQTKAQIDLMNGVITGSSNTKCYTMEDLSSYFDNKGKYTGKVTVVYSAGNLTLTGSMSSDKYKITDQGSDLKTDNVEENKSGKITYTCS